MGDVTQEELAEWQRRCDAATPGEWTPRFKPHSKIDPSDEWHVDAAPPFGCVSCGLSDGDAQAQSDAAFIAAARSAMPRLIAEVARLRAEHVRCEPLESAYLSTVSSLTSERSTLAARLAEVEKERDEALRETERWRHDVKIEGDFVCPSDLERDALRVELATADNVIVAARRAISSAGYCGDGNLAAMVTRALIEAQQRGRDQTNEFAEQVSIALVDANSEFPDEMTGTVAERVRLLRAELATVRAVVDAAEKAVDLDRHTRETGDGDQEMHVAFCDLENAISALRAKEGA